MVFSDHGEDTDDKRNEERPDETRHSMEPVAKQLDREAGGVEDCDVVAKHREREYDQGELRPADWMVDLANQTT